MFLLTFPLQIFAKRYFQMKDIIKIVRQLLAAAMGYISTLFSLVAYQSFMSICETKKTTENKYTYTIDECRTLNHFSTFIYICR